VRGRRTLAAVFVGVAVIIGGAAGLSLGRADGSPSRADDVAARPVASTTTEPADGGCPTTVTSGQVAVGTPTKKQREAAQRLISSTRAALRPYEDFAVAQQRGFVSLDQMHYYQPSWYGDERVLDPVHPEFLMYDNAHRLLGAMYIQHERAGTQLGGPLTVWHTHCGWQMPCLLPGNILLSPDTKKCGGHPRVHDWMLHVWLVPNRLGAFGHDMVAPSSSQP
jgi:hypothetical protein